MGTPSPTSSHNTHDPAMMICYRECLSNLEKFGGGEERKALQFISNIERISKMINANENILHCMCTAKLEGEAKRWYEDNASVTGWAPLKSALLERFTQSDSSSRIFEQLKERKQRPDETITAYYDEIIKLCREYDETMSHKLKLSWLENGIKESLKVPIKRQLKLLPEEERTAEVFLKIAKDEQELQHTQDNGHDSTFTHAPYFTNAVSTTNRTNDQNTSARTNKGRRPDLTFQRQTAEDHRTARNQQRSMTSDQHLLQQRHENNQANRADTQTNARKFSPCIICRRRNHRTIDCYQKKPNGCYRCGHSDHNVRDCSEVFC